MWWSLGWVVKQSSGGRRPGAWVWAPRAGFHFWKYCNWTIGVIRNICVMHKSSIQANMFMVLIPSQLTSIQLLEFFPVQKSLLLLLSLPVALSEPVNVNASRLMFLMPAKKDAWPCLPFIFVCEDVTFMIFFLYHSACLDCKLCPAGHRGASNHCLHIVMRAELCL